MQLLNLKNNNNKQIQRQIKEPVNHHAKSKYVHERTENRQYSTRQGPRKSAVGHYQNAANHRSLCYRIFSGILKKNKGAIGRQGAQGGAQGRQKWGKHLTTIWISLITIVRGVSCVLLGSTEAALMGNFNPISRWPAKCAMKTA